MLVPITMQYSPEYTSCTHYVCLLLHCPSDGQYTVIVLYYTLYYIIVFKISNIFILLTKYVSFIIR